MFPSTPRTLQRMSDFADRHGRTHRLELSDQTLREWDATVLDSDAESGIVLDRSAFYPGGGGQPPDAGVLLWGGVQTRIVGVRRGDDLHLLPHQDDPLPPPGTAVRRRVCERAEGWTRGTQSPKPTPRRRDNGYP